MTSIIMNLINDTLRVFLMQYKDGIGCLYHVVFMVRITTLLSGGWFSLKSYFWQPLFMIQKSKILNLLGHAFMKSTEKASINC